MHIRKSRRGDIAELSALFNEARKTIATLGIDQWQDGYPSKEVIERDISSGASYAVEKDGVLAASFALFENGDPCYDKIDGKWKSGDGRNYVAIHRVAIKVLYRGSGISSFIIAYAEEYAKSLGRASLRIDTHEGNAVMRKMLEKNGFSYCGKIRLENGDGRVAYEKLI